MLWLQSVALGACYALRIPLPVSWRSDTAQVANPTSPRSSTPQQEVEVSVSEMLRQALKGLGVREIWEYLEDPKTPTSPAMRREEQSRPATVEHIRYVKNNLDAVKKMLLRLLSSVDGVDVSKMSRVGTKRQVDNSQLEGIVEQVVERNIKEIVTGMEKMAENISKLEKDISMVLQRLK